MRVGFVGLGLMGLPIARHFAAAGHRLFVASGSRAPLDELAALGATVCASPREIAPQVEIFFSCRVTPEQSRQTFLGEDGILATAASGMLCVDLATTDPETARDIAAQLERMRERTPRGGTKWNASSVKQQLDQARRAGLTLPTSLQDAE